MGPDHFRHEFSVYSVKFDPTFVGQIESKVNELIHGDDGTVQLETVADLDCATDREGLIVIPGQKYPEGVRQLLEEIKVFDDVIVTFWI